MTDDRDTALLAGLKVLSGVSEFRRECSVCGKASNKGWGCGLHKDWQTDKWYCLDHCPWIKGATSQ
jgi:hypothetical protein